MTAKEASMADKRGEMARDILDEWDMDHFGRKPIADSSFQYATREDMIRRFTAALESAYRDGLEDMREHAAKKVERLLSTPTPRLNYPDAIRALPLDPKEAQDAEG